MAIFHDFTQVRGAGALIHLPGLSERCALAAELLCFANFSGPTGSFKDSLAEGMIRMAEQSGKLAAAAPVFGSGTGGFAAALTLAGYRTGHPVTLCIGAGAPTGRRQLLGELGAKLVLCSSADGQRGWDDRAARLAAEQGGWFADYYADDLNPEFHRRVTGPAILKETEGKLDFVVAAVGSGGTISGVGEYIKAWTNGIRIVAVEPVESQVLSGGFAGPHGLEGIGCGFVPENYNPYIVDQVIPVSTGDGREAARQALLTDGLPLSPAAGAALAAALQLAVMPENAGKRVVAIVGGRSIF